MTDVDHERPRLDRAALEHLLAGLTAVRGGDFSTRLSPAGDPLVDEIAAVFNRMVEQLDQFTSEVTRVAREVGTDGKLGGQANVPGVSGTWKDLTESVNAMAGNLTWQVRNIAQVATAVAKGDLSQKIDVDARGEILELKTTLNTMVDQLSAFADEVTRVAREVGSQGNLGGQAMVHGVSGTWKDLTDNVNSMANNLTSQVRNIAQVTTAVAQGDLTKKIDVDAQGEILQLKTTINTMVDQLSAVRRRGHPRRPRGGPGRQARRAGRGRGRVRHLEAADRERQRAGRQPDPPGARHLRGDQLGRGGRPDPDDLGRGGGRGRRAERQHQRHGAVAARDRAGLPGPGLAEDQLGQHRLHAAGAP